MSDDVRDPVPDCPTCGQPMEQVVREASEPAETPGTDGVVVPATWRCAHAGCPGSGGPTQERDRTGDEESEAEANEPTGAQDVGA